MSRTMTKRNVVRISVVWLVVLLSAGLFSGCQPHAEAKKAAKDRWDKASAQIKLSLAQQQYDSGRYEQATKLVKECLQGDPEKAEAHLLMGKLHLAEGRPVRALDEMQQTVELNENLAEGWYWHGVASQQLGRIADANSSYGKALEVYPTNIDYILAVAEVLTASERIDEAIALLRDKIAVMVQNVSLKVAGADLLCRVGQYDEAVQLYRQALLLDEDDESVVESLGYCYMFANRWSEAAEIFVRLADEQLNKKEEATNDSPEAGSLRERFLEMAAFCSMNAGQYDQAVASYGQLAVGQRDSAEMWVRLGQAALGARMTDRALSCGERALGLRTGYPDAIALIGCAEYIRGNYADSLVSFERITGDESNAPLAWLMIARCHEQLGESDKAAGAYKRALEMNPDSELGDFLGKSIKVSAQDKW